MALQTRIESDVYVAGNLSANEITFPDGAIDNDAIEGAASIDATKIQQQYQITLSQSLVTSSDQTNIIHYVRGATAEVISFVAGSITKNGGDSTVTANLIKCNSGGTTAVISAPITLNSSSTAYSAIAATVVSSGVEDMVAGDQLKVVLDATAGTSASLATGVFVSLCVREEAN